MTHEEREACDEIFRTNDTMINPDNLELIRYDTTMDEEVYRDTTTGLTYYRCTIPAKLHDKLPNPGPSTPCVAWNRTAN